jgi:pyruvate/2-oxoglutarate dehydrogenase complex dihydrolipoamide acyltransferase (E2) component
MYAFRIARRVSKVNINLLTSCRSYQNSKLWNARIVEMVPALGESITEGTIASWYKSVGDQINVDDVVAMVETDKVTVEIKSTFAGIMIERSVETDETVIVGQPLYEIETDASSAASKPSAQVAEPVAQPVATSEKAQVVSAPHETHARVPMIHFLGKRSLIPAKSEHSIAVNTPSSTAKAPSKPPTAISPIMANMSELPAKPQTGVDFTTLKGKGFYGRPALTAKEIEAIESGGATDF